MANGISKDRRQGRYLSNLADCIRRQETSEGIKHWNCMFCVPCLGEGNQGFKLTTLAHICGDFLVCLYVLVCLINQDIVHGDRKECRGMETRLMSRSIQVIDGSVCAPPLMLRPIRRLRLPSPEIRDTARNNLQMHGQLWEIHIRMYKSIYIAAVSRYETQKSVAQIYDFLRIGLKSLETLRTVKLRIRCIPFSLDCA